MKTQIKTPTELAHMRESGRMLATVLKLVCSKAEPGISTKQLATIAAEELRRLGGKPAFLGHEGFSDVICISINEEIVHGIPNSERILAEGDIVGIDFGVTYNGMITDGARTIIVGKPLESAHSKLVERTEQSMYAGINVVHDKVRVGDISAAVESSLRPYGYGIPTDLVGHGVGHQLWEWPNIPNRGQAHTGPWLDSGMTIAIEPMVTLGTSRVILKDDGWTITTADRSRAAHFEHTVLITPDGAEILTQV